MTTDSQTGWSEADSLLYRRLASVAVPARLEQITALLTLLPFKRAEAFRAVDLGCGEGILSYALLDCFPQAEVVALDGSPGMRVQAINRLTPFRPRFRVEAFDLASQNWLHHVQTADCVVSSLCLHHLRGPQKKRLFGAVNRRLSARGVLLIADLVEPQRPEARALFAATWDRLAEAQSIAETGSEQLFEQFVKAEWNYYRFDDPVDTPSPLFDQLTWLKTAGFEGVDCFWLQAGHAIYGGYKTQSGESGGNVPFAAALRSAEAALHTAG